MKICRVVDLLCNSCRVSCQSRMSIFFEILYIFLPIQAVLVAGEPLVKLKSTLEP